MNDLCSSCKRIRPLVWYEDTNTRGLCQQCFDSMPLPLELQSLIYLAITTPFRVGDKVAAWAGAEIYEGVGVIKEVSFALEHGGTPVFPTFKVAFEDKAYPEVPDEAWYTQVCLRLESEVMK